MNYKNIQHMALSMIIVFPPMTHSMQRALTLSKRPLLSRKLTTQSLFIDESASRTRINTLRNTIAVPKFKLSTVQEIIQPHTVNLDREGIHNLTEYIIWKATEHTAHEKRYADVLKQLRLNGWSKDACCIKLDYDSGQMVRCHVLHSAVISNLPCVTQELLIRDSDWVHARDLHNCIPLHYAPSPRIAQMLLDNGSDLGARDRDGNAPLHTVPHAAVPTLLNTWPNKQAVNHLYVRVPGYGWRGLTPLRKAVDEGDVQKCGALLDCTIIISSAPAPNEKEILLSLADLRFWRTKNPAYLKIKKMILEHCRYHFEEKH